LFPIGGFVLLRIWFLPVFFFQPLDGESIQDGPVNPLFAQGIWWMVSLAFVIRLLWLESGGKQRVAG